MMERFFLSLKAERVWQRDYANHAEAMTDFFKACSSTLTPCGSGSLHLRQYAYTLCHLGKLRRQKAPLATPAQKV